MFRRWLRSHLTYANVMVTILAFLVLGGGSAVALSGSNTVFSDDIVDNEVKTADVRNDTLSGGGLGAADLQANSVGTAEAVNNSLTGTDVNEAMLNLAAGAWREVGAAGEPPFTDNGFCAWTNFDTGAPAHNSGAFLRDRFGFVHVKGLVDAEGGCSADLASGNDAVIFNLPAGYRPARREIFATITNGAFGRVNVDGPVIDPSHGAGAVSVEPPTTEANAKAWLSLDGISFRCAPSGSNGCP